MTPRAEVSVPQVDEKAALEYLITKQLEMYDTTNLNGLSGIVRIPMMTAEMLEFAKKTCANIGPWMLQTGMFDAVTGIGVLKYKYPRRWAPTNKVMVIADQGSYSIWGDRAVETEKPELPVLDFKLSMSLFEASSKALRPVVKPVPSNSLAVVIAQNAGLTPAPQAPSPFDQPPFEESTLSMRPLIPEDESPSEFGVLMNMGQLKDLLPK